MKLLLAVDIVHSAAPTIEELAALVPLKGMDVMLLYVKEELPSYERVVESAGDFDDDWQHRLEQQARKAFEEASAALAAHGARVTTEIVAGPPAMMIEAVARDEKFDVTALTPGAHGRVEMFLLGSTSSKVVKHGPGTVLICRSRERREQKLRHVVVGIDGSMQSQYALDTGVKQFAIDPGESTITLAHIVNVADVLKMVSPVEYISMVENNLLLEGETYLAEAKAMLSERGFKRVDCVLKEGDPATELINLSRSLPADLVLIGAQGRTAVQHFLLGSVSHRIAMRSASSVAVVKRPH